MSLQSPHFRLRNTQARRLETSSSSNPCPFILHTSRKGRTTRVGTRWKRKRERWRAGNSKAKANVIKLTNFRRVRCCCFLLLLFSSFFVYLSLLAPAAAAPPLFVLSFPIHTSSSLLSSLQPSSLFFPCPGGGDLSSSSSPSLSLVGCMLRGVVMID